MDIAELRHLARRLCAWLRGGIAPDASYQQCLHYVAAVVGRRNWSEVVALPPPGSPMSPPPPARRFDEPDASRLARRLRAELGIEVSVRSLLGALSRPEARPPELWPEGIEPGVYVITDPAAIVAAIAMYRIGSRRERYYVETPSPHAPGAEVLAQGGLKGIEAIGLCSGTLVLADAIDLSEAAWQESVARVRVACEVAGSRHLRILLPVRAHTPPGETLAHVQLLARCAGRELVEQIRDILPDTGPRTQIVDWSKTESVMVTDRRPWALTRDNGYLPLEPLPREVADAVESAVVASPYGLVVVGKVGGLALPAEELLDAMLAPTEAAGPAARIVDRAGDHDADPWALPWCRLLPWQPSVAAAYANGFRRMVINAPGLLTRDMIDYADRACIIVNAGQTPDVAAALDVLARGERRHHAVATCAPMSLRRVPLGRLLAVVGILSCAARGRPRETIADCYVRRQACETFTRSVADASDFIVDGRIVAFEGQLRDLLVRKVLTPDDVLYHFLDVSPRSRIRAALKPDRRAA